MDQYDGVAATRMEVIGVYTGRDNGLAKFWALSHGTTVPTHTSFVINCSAFAVSHHDAGSALLGADGRHGPDRRCHDAGREVNQGGQHGGLHGLNCGRGGISV